MKKNHNKIGIKNHKTAVAEMDFFNIISLNFIGGMRFSQYGFRARLKNYNDNKES